jgi:septal ring factor EnvC (AmiA/AmiB activator)
MPSPTGFLITFCVGIAATLAWQTYGDTAREMIASSYPQLEWLAPRPTPAAQNADGVIALAAPAASFSDQQQLNAMALDAVRQSLDRIAAGQEEITHSVDRIAPGIDAGQEQVTQSIGRIAASQEQIARSIDRLTAGQEQMTREITKLQEIAQYFLYKNSEPPPRPAPAPARNPIPRSSQAPTVR